MSASTLSLLSFLDAPVLVGDPEGRAAYVNPAFEARFGVTAEGVTGRPLAVLFDGALREAMLRAVADVCARGTTARFHLRHAGVGYAAVASPIVAEDARVGVVVVLVEHGASDERLHAVGKRIQQSCDDLGTTLSPLGTRLAARGEGAQLEAVAKAHGQLRQANLELQALLSGRPLPAPSTRFEPARMLADIAARVRGDVEESGGSLDLRLADPLPLVRGEPARLASALVDLLRERVAARAATQVLAARAHEQHGRTYVVVSLLEGDASAAPEPARLRQAVEELGGQLRSSVDPRRGRTLAFRLPADVAEVGGRSAG